MAKGVSGTFAWLSRSTAIHMLTVGALGTLTLGMLSRVALGHTGRKLVISPIMVLGYLLFSGAAVVRVVMPLPGHVHAAEGMAPSRAGAGKPGQRHRPGVRGLARPGSLFGGGRRPIRAARHGPT